MRQTQTIGSIKSLPTSNRLLSFRLSVPENNIPSYIAEKSDKLNQQEFFRQMSTKESRLKVIQKVEKSNKNQNNVCIKIP